MANNRYHSQELRLPAQSILSQPSGPKYSQPRTNPSSDSAFASPANTIYDFELKAAIVGDTGVGKSQLLSHTDRNNSFKNAPLHKGFEDRSKRDIYQPSFKGGSSVGLNIKNVDYEYNDYHCQIQYWDCAGSERYMKLTTRYCAGMTAVIFVYNVNSTSSFENLELWTKEVDKYANGEVVKILVGNRSLGRSGAKRDLKKNDLAKSVEGRQVSLSRAEAFADQHKMDYFEIDTDSGLNCQTIFDSLISRIVDSIPSPPEPSLLLGRNIKIGQKLLNEPNFRDLLYEQAKRKAKESRETSLYMDWLQ